jgi:hypothetical protein
MKTNAVVTSKENWGQAAEEQTKLAALAASIRERFGAAHVRLRRKEKTGAPMDDDQGPVEVDVCVAATAGARTKRGDAAYRHRRGKNGTSLWCTQPMLNVRSPDYGSVAGKKGRRSVGGMSASRQIQKPSADG